MLNIASPLAVVTQPDVIVGFLSKKEVPLWGRVGPDYKGPKLLDRVHFACRRRHLSPRTESSYIHWIKRYIFFHQKQHPKDLDARHIEAFLNHLAVQRRVSASTQSIALNALAFLYKQVLQLELPELDNLVRAKKPKRLPVVLSREEVKRLLDQMEGAWWLMASLLYGAGLRLQECATLRIKDIDFDYQSITVRAGKGAKDRTTLLPPTLVDPLKAHITRIKARHDQDLAEGAGYTKLPQALNRKYPNAEREFAWQYLFPSATRRWDNVIKVERRWHVSPSSLQKAFRRALKQAQIHKHAGSHTLRHSFATHLLESGYDIRTIQELLGHRHVQTTMIYTHVLQAGGQGVRSPLESL